MFGYLSIGFFALVLTIILTPFAMFLARKVGAIDYPGERRVHAKPIPRLGGVAMYLSFVATTLYFLPLTRQLIGLMLGATILLGVGIYDDIKGVTPKIKLLGQIAAALVLLFFGYEMKSLTLPLVHTVDLTGWGGGLFVVFWVVGLVNTVNITDGLDGLAAGICFGACLVLLWAAVRTGQEYPAADLLAGLAGACLGFLFFNFHPARVFMGDSGSMFLGYAIASVSILGLLKTPVIIGLVLPLLVLGMPIIDMTFAVIRRKWKGQPIALADRGHLHHRLLDIGLSHKQAVLALYLMSAALGGAAVFLSLEDWQWAVGLMVAVCMVLTVVFLTKSRQVARRTGGK